MTVANTYNNRLQPVAMSAVSNASTHPSILNLTYDFRLGAGDNGNVWAVQNGRFSGRSVTYNYDPLNRLTSAATQATSGSDCWSFNYGYDAWGNLNGASVPTCPSNVDPKYRFAFSNPFVANQTPGYCYDAAGNLINPGVGCLATYAYDGENRLASIAGGIYTYDGNGNRVSKMGSATTPTLYWRGMGADTLTETNLSGTPNEDYVMFGGQRVARVDLPSGTVHYYFSDHLGSASEITSADGTTIEQETTYYPYGGEHNGSGTPNRYKFTGKERDTESGLDYFGARYYGSSMGRWMSPDWAAGPNPVPYAIFDDPQTLNLYGYVRNNPLRHADADGHCCDWSDVRDFFLGAANAYGSDNLFGAGRVEQTSAAGKVGAAVGDAVATVQGTGEALAGTGVEGGGLVLDATGVGAIVGVPANVVGAGMIVHGGSTALIGGANLMKAATEPGSRPGQDFTPAGKRQSDARDGSKCQNCGRDVESVQNQKGQPTPPNQRQRHHIKPKSEGGSGTPENGKTLCPDCHKEEHQKIRQEKEVS